VLKNIESIIFSKILTKIMLVSAISRVKNIGNIVKNTYLIYSKLASFSLKFSAEVMWLLAI
jgi:hypothetical protein